MKNISHRVPLIALAMGLSLLVLIGCESGQGVSGVTDSYCDKYGNRIYVQTNGQYGSSIAVSPADQSCADRSKRRPDFLQVETR